MSNRNKWLDEEIEYLRLNYETKGVTYLVENLTGHTKNSICKKAQSIGLSVDKTIYSYNEEEVRLAVKSSFNYKEVLRSLNKVSSGTAYEYLIKYIRKNNIDTSHFDSWKNNRIINSKRNYNLDEIFIENSKDNGGTVQLKKKLVENGLLKYKCVKCNNTGEWMGVELTLQLDHKNGISNDNRLENLRFLCPNCHSQTETYAGKNNKK